MRTLLERCVKDLTQSIDRFPWHEEKAYADWLAQKLSGYRAQKLGPFGLLEVLRFDR